MAVDLKKLNKEQLIKYITELREQLENEKFGLYFDRKAIPEKIIVECQQKIPLLERVYEKEIKGSNDKNHILIEGDNFQVLTSLNSICPAEGLVDVIYIDPPYNTGSEDFIYNDKFVDIEDGFRHTKWLNFMESRLTLARKIMKNDGVIFISINDIEQAHLKLLCNSIFGEKNFIEMFLWNKNKGGTSLSNFSKQDYEYILCYSKNKSLIDYTFLGSYSEGMGDSSLINKPNKYQKLTFKKGTITFPSIKTSNLNKGIYEGLELHNDLIIENNKNKNDVEISCNWKWNQEYLDNQLSLGTKIISKTLGLRLRYIKNNAGDIITPTKSIQSSNGVGYNLSASSELKSLLGNDDFDYPKPPSLIKYLINMCTYNNKNATILDFFAGSGTTGQATLELNCEDGGNRRFIICTSNEVQDKTLIRHLKSKGIISEEKNINKLKTELRKYMETDDYKELIKTKEYEELGICNQITQKRILKFMENSKKINDNVYYYKSIFLPTEENKDQMNYNLVQKVDSLLCILEDTYSEIEKNNVFSIYKNNSKITIIYRDIYNKEIFNKLNEFINKNNNIPIVMYVFSTDNNVDESIIKKINNITIKPIPNKIYEIYKTLMGKMREDYLL